jgi:ubiquinone/menaquinone biosynthesis C-methylase UbiE
MNREMTNRVRYILEDLLPPALRDSRLFRSVMRITWGHHVDRFANFRQRAPFLSLAEYDQLYEDYPHIHDSTDNSEACIRRIIEDSIGPDLCDVGCGSGLLLRRIAEERQDIISLTGVDVQLGEAGPGSARISFRQGRVEGLPFADRSFDTVICTHVIEHVLDYRKAISELRRIARRRLIIVVPRERECLYTFNPHFHFFPYTHSFLRAMHPVPDHHICEDIQRDIYYREDS